jgi:hypothetical protein
MNLPPHFYFILFYAPQFLFLTKGLHVHNVARNGCYSWIADDTVRAKRVDNEEGIKPAIASLALLADP